MVFYRILAILLILILWSFIEKHFLIVSKYKIKSQKVLLSKKSIHIVMIADLHNNTFGRKNDRLFQRIEKEKPDFIIAAGDIITKRKPCAIGPGYDILEQLAKKYPVYYGYGNHELFFERLANGLEEEDGLANKDTLVASWFDYIDKLKSLGVTILTNDSETIVIHGNSIRITGLSVPKEYYPKGRKEPPSLEVSSFVGDRSKEYQILIAHNPMYFKEYVQWGADMIASGHVHGGLGRLPFIGGIISPQYNFFPKYDAGVYTEYESHMVVSKGLGSHSIMLRCFNPPDIVHIEIHSEEATYHK